MERIDEALLIVMFFVLRTKNITIRREKIRFGRTGCAINGPAIPVV